MRAGRLELPHLAALDPKSSVSTNSTTPAFSLFPKFNMSFKVNTHLTYVPKDSRNRDANINIPWNIQITCAIKFISFFVLLTINKKPVSSIEEMI